MTTVVLSGVECTGEGQLANLTNPIEVLPKGNRRSCQLKAKFFPLSYAVADESRRTRRTRRTQRIEQCRKKVPTHQSVKRKLTKSFRLSWPESTCHVSTGSCIALFKFPLIIGFYV